MREDRVTARVFTDADGMFGNEVLVVLGDRPRDAATRQECAATASAPATVFVDADRAVVRVHNRERERPFAGHPLLGTAAVLREAGVMPEALRTPAGSVRTWADPERADMLWLHAPAEWSPNARHRRVATPAEVEALTGPPADEPVQIWAWAEESAGAVRARQFAPSEGKPEDEACGSASMVLAAALGRPLTVVHGRGSVIQVRPRADGVDLGGRCVVLR